MAEASTDKTEASAAAAAPAAASAVKAEAMAGKSDSAWLPLVEVRFENVSYSIMQTKKQANRNAMASVMGSIANTFIGPVKAIARCATSGRSAEKPTEFKVLDDVSGVIRPASLTLLIAPPGHGKSAYLKMLTQLLPTGKAGVRGRVTYSGVDAAGAPAAGVHLGQLVQYVSQLDNHLPFMTVRETLEFYHSNATIDPASHGHPELAGQHAAEVDKIISLLHLGACQHTVVGDALLRGVSGGEKKRVTVGEGLLTNARFLALDEISTGLDSAVTFDIVHSLKKRAQRNGLGVVVSLLQPTPEVYSLFDDIVLLREGAVVYHGPTAELPAYLRGLGFRPPVLLVPENTSLLPGGGASGIAREESASSTSSTSGAAAAISAGAGSGGGGAINADMCDWLVDWLTAPKKLWQRDEQAARAAEAEAAAANGGGGVGVAASTSAVEEPMATLHTPSVVSPLLGQQQGQSSASARKAAPTAAPIVLVHSKSSNSIALPSTESGPNIIPPGSSPHNASGSPVEGHNGNNSSAGVLVAGGVPLTTEGLAAAWKGSALFAAQMAAPPAAPPLQLKGDFARAQYSSSYSNSTGKHISLLVGRQFIMMRRNALYLRSRIVTATLMSFILGGLYYQRSVAQALTFFGLFLNSQMTLGFGNLSEMAGCVMTKYIAYRHVANGAYPSWAYVLAGFVAHLPVAVTECLIFTSIVYFMAGLNAAAGNFFFFFLVVLITDIFFRNLMALFSYLGRTLQAAQAMPLPIIAILILFAGFLVTRDHMGWLLFMNYIVIFGYNLRSLAQNEYFSPRYNFVPLNANPLGLTQGQLYLTDFGLQTDPGWQWGGVGFALGAAVLVICLSFVAFDAVRFDRNIGSTREKASAEDEAADATKRTLVLLDLNSTKKGPGSFFSTKRLGQMMGGGSGGKENGAGGGSGAAVSIAMPSTKGILDSTSVTQSVLPFSPMTVVFKDIRYTVVLPKHMGGGTRTLLQGVSGYARPGRLLSLMGASGAGKTTLLDVLAGRKNSGIMEGTILLNGFPKDVNTFNRVAAYVEQNDIHTPLQTVREALHFSAKLRLPASVTHSQRIAFVDEVLALLELEEIADRKVGGAGEPDGLSPGERKRLTIGVELVSNAPIIFCDEPTSGLDSRAAAVVMRVLRAVANTGRTCIVTVHQPSAELFFMFDDLLLLQRGGYQVYLGPLGRHGRDIVRYLSTVPGMPPYPRGLNPASYMLDALGGTNSSKKDGAKAAVAVVAAATSTPAGADKIAADGGVPEKQQSSAAVASVSSIPSGEVLQASLRGSHVWATAVAVLEKHSVPAPGTTALSFSSRYARSFPVQIQALVVRTWLSYSRNVGLNYGRLIALTMLNLIFGTVYYHIAENSGDVSGVQSLVAAIFMTSAFGGNINLNVIVPAHLGQRSVFYREVSSFYFDPLSLSIANFVVELPWLFGIILSTMSIVYFMIGLSSDPNTFFFHLFVSYVLAVVYVSIGMFLAAAMPTFEVAQAFLGVIAPLFFLFGGLFSPISAMAPGARWFCYIDPITYAFRALIPSHFYCDVASGTCPVLVNPGVGPQRIYDYVSEKYELDYFARWENLGYLALFIIAFQLFAGIATRYCRYIVR